MDSQPPFSEILLVCYDIIVSFHVSTNVFQYDNDPKEAACRHGWPRLQKNSSSVLRRFPDLNPAEQLDKMRLQLHPRPSQPTSVPDHINVIVDQ